MKAPFELIQKPSHPIDTAFRAREIIGYTLRHNTRQLFDSWQIGSHPDDSFGIIDPTGHITPFVAYPRQIASSLQPNGIWRVFIASNQLGANVVRASLANSLGLQLTPRQFRFRLTNYEAAIVPANHKSLHR